MPKQSLFPVEKGFKKKKNFSLPPSLSPSPLKKKNLN
jgi:hypothetical protein